MAYFLTPFIAWLVTGGIKFMINSYQAKRWSFDKIGYGGMPSNHSAIVSSMVALIGVSEGINHPAFGVALTLAFIVILDAHSLRREVGKHAHYINQLLPVTTSKLRERMGHSFLEIVVGVMVGVVVGCLMWVGNH